MIEAQNLRDDLALGTLKRTDAVKRVADYGARLWNARVTGLDPNARLAPGAANPFLAELVNPGGLFAWSLSERLGGAAGQCPAGGQDTAAVARGSARPFDANTLILPPVQPTGNVLDPMLVDKLSRAAEQVNADGRAGRRPRDWTAQMSPRCHRSRSR